MTLSRFAACFITTILGGMLATPRAEPQEPKTAEALIQQTTDADAVHRIEAAAALGERPQPGVQAIEALIKLLADREPEVRSTAARSLGQIGKPAKAAVPALIKLFADDARGQQEQPVWHVAGEAVGRMGADSLPELLRLLDDAALTTRYASAVAIHGIGAAAGPAVPKLLKQLEDNNPETRVAMMYGLMGIGPDSAPAIPMLIKMLDSEDFHTQYWACRTIGRIGIPAAQPAIKRLIELLSNTNPSVRANAAAALGNLGPEAGAEVIPPLIKLLKDRLYNVRRAAAIAVGQMGISARDAVPVLDECLKNPEFAARCQAAVARWRITNEIDPTLEVLLHELDHRDAPWDAAEGFRDIGPPAAVAVNRLIERLGSKNNETRVFASSALASLGPAARPAIPKLRAMLNDDDSDVREVAREAIQAIEDVGTEKASTIKC